jgi:hypothetical protein
MWAYALPILFFGYVIYCGLQDRSETSVEFTVKDKERIHSGNTSYYLIYTDIETFKCTDNLFYGKWNSSDMYGSLERGKRYKAQVIGWRIPFLSMYRNIVKMKQIP